MINHIVGRAREAFSSPSQVAALALALLFSAAMVSLVWAGTGKQNGVGAGLLPVEVPASSVEHPGDVGVRAHTNFLILLRPDKIMKRPSASGPVGETPGSLACVYQTSGASLSDGCPITGNPSDGNNGLPNASGGSKTIAVVDAYDYPTAYSDLSHFSTTFGLPVLPLCSASVKTGCFQQVYASGTQPSTNGSWALEAALDIEWAHAMAPGARIVLVEAASGSLADLFAATDVATNEVVCGAASCPSGGSGVGEVSMSWGSSEFSLEAGDDAHFQTTGVVYFAAAGDSGGKPIYPSVSPYVVSAGGTTVNRDTSGDFVSETTWSSGGGGPSRYESRPSYQDPVSNLVGGKRGTPDFSFDANPNTGVFVYDTTSYAGQTGWWILGGTSVSSPSLAGIVNLAASSGSGSFQSSGTGELDLIYGICSGSLSTDCSSANFRDITSGRAGKYSAATGWDFTTGLGSSLTLAGK